MALFVSNFLDVSTTLFLHEQFELQTKLSNDGDQYDFISLILNKIPKSKLKLKLLMHNVIEIERQVEKRSNLFYIILLVYLRIINTVHYKNILFSFLLKNH
jgi:hypothetical protein